MGREVGRWLTPDTLPAAELRRALFVPQGLPWLECVYGALLLLNEPENWEQFGALTPDESAAAFDTVLHDLIFGRGYVLAVGDIFFSGNGVCPDDCLICDGAQVEQSAYPALYAALGFAFGSADPGYFRLPNLAGKSPRGIGTGFDLGQSGGADSVSLETTNLPSHDHSLPGHTHVIDTGISISAVGPGDFPVQSAELLPGSTGSGGSGSTGSTGSGTDVDTTSPYIALNAYIVAL